MHCTGPSMRMLASAMRKKEAPPLVQRHYCLGRWVSHKALHENLGGARCDGRGRSWEHRGRAERAPAER